MNLPVVQQSQENLITRWKRVNKFLQDRHVQELGRFYFGYLGHKERRETSWYVNTVTVVSQVNIIARISNH